MKKASRRPKLKRLNFILCLIFAYCLFPFNSHAMENAPSVAYSHFAQNDSSQAATASKSTAGDYGAFSAAGEFGYNSLRGSGTYGVYFTPCQRIKFSGEYLTQKLEYHFKSGGRKHWASQFALGGEYQFLLNSSVFQSIDLAAAYSHAYSKKLGSKDFNDCILKRRIAGSNGALTSLGTTVKLWKCAFLSGDLTYDWVRFERVYQSDKLANGFGGAFKFVQQFAKDFSFNLGAEFSSPFNDYQASLDWNHMFSSWGIGCGLFGGYTDGKEGVPNIGTGGVRLNISFGGKGSKCCRKASTESSACYDRAYCNVLQWVATPAVRVPVVLTVADQKETKCVCIPPTSLAIPDQFAGCVGTFTIPLAQFFTSSVPLTYTLTLDTSPAPGSSISIDPTTGTITIQNNNQSQTVIATVTATSRCGSTSQSFFLTTCD